MIVVMLFMFSLIYYYGRFVSSSMNMLLVVISMLVLKFGCSIIRLVGMLMMIKVMSMVLKCGGSGILCRYYVIIIGRFIFSSLVGCR